MTDYDSEKHATDQSHESYSDNAKARRVTLIHSSGTYIGSSYPLFVSGTVTSLTSGSVDASQRGDWRVQIIDSRGTVNKSIDGKIRTSSMPYLFDIAEGNVENHSSFTKYGKVSGLSNVEQDVWSNGGIYKFPPKAGEVMSIKSTSAYDTSAGVGAQKVKVEYLTTDWLEATETVSLSGTTPVNTSATMVRVNRFLVDTMGSSGSMGGTIDLYGTSGTYARIDVGYTQSRQLIYSVPRNKNLFVTSARYSSGEGGNTVKVNFVTFTERATYTGSGTKTFFLPLNEIGMINNSFLLNLEMPTKIGPTSDLKVSAKGDYSGASSSCTVALRGWLENV